MTQVRTASRVRIDALHPTLAKMAVSAAKRADSSAHGSQLACIGISFIAPGRSALRSPPAASPGRRHGRSTTAQSPPGPDRERQSSRTLPIHGGCQGPATHPPARRRRSSRATGTAESMTVTAEPGNLPDDVGKKWIVRASQHDGVGSLVEERTEILLDQ